jgi:predicted transcriptional regulator of viral defense system
MDLTDLIADEIHVTLPRSQRGRTIPDGVRAHFTDRPIQGQDGRKVLGVPITGVERTIADVVRSDGWSEQVGTGRGVSHELPCGAGGAAQE